MRAKKVLLLSYYFPPAKSVAGLRAWSWAQYGHQYGLNLTVLTLNWKDDDVDLITVYSNDGKISTEINEKFKVIRVPAHSNRILKAIPDFCLKIPLFRKVLYMLLSASGNLNTEADAHQSFKAFLLKHLKGEPYDYLLVTSPPLNIIKLAYEIHNITGIPYHVDLRDLWNNQYLKTDYVPAFNVKVLDYFKKRYLKKWISKSLSISTVSQPLALELKRIYNGEIKVITNGFEPSVINKISKVADKRFRFTLAGTYYKLQPLEILIEGLKLFMVTKKPEEIVIQLIGLSSNKEVLDLLCKSFPSQYLHIEDRLSPEEAALFIVNSEVLFQAGWKGYKGIYTTKIFDFIASGNPVIVAPGDSNVIDDLINETGAGYIVNSVNEFNELLTLLYDEWKSTGTITIQTNKEAVARYSREVLAGELAAIFLNHEK